MSCKIQALLKKLFTGLHAFLFSLVALIPHPTPVGSVVVVLLLLLLL
jgi:hypothetical protein